MLWNEQTEKHFFKEALKSFASPEQLFYNLQSGYYAYIPKDFDSEGKTLQSRNSLIGQFTEKWCKQIFSPIAEEFGLYYIYNEVITITMKQKEFEVQIYYSGFCTYKVLAENKEEAINAAQKKQINYDELFSTLDYWAEANIAKEI